jgi:hypothetical protein
MISAIENDAVSRLQRLLLVKSPYPLAFLSLMLVSTNRKSPHKPGSAVFLHCGLGGFV